MELNRGLDIHQISRFQMNVSSAISHYLRIFKLRNRLVINKDNLYKVIWL